MEEKYTFEMMWEDLNNGYQIFYTYVRNRYLLFKTAPNCYKIGRASCRERV